MSRHHRSLPLFLTCAAMLLVYGGTLFYFIQGAIRQRRRQ